MLNLPVYNPPLLATSRLKGFLFPNVGPLPPAAAYLALRDPSSQFQIKVYPSFQFIAPAKPQTAFFHFQEL